MSFEKGVMNLTENWKVFALLSAIFAALTSVFGKVGVEGINSNFATFIRTLVILIFIGGILYFSDFTFSSFEKLSQRSVGFLVISGICTGLSWLCYYRALQLGPVSGVTPVDKMSVVIAILIAWIFLGEKITWNIGFGGVLITLGTIVILFN